MEQIFATEQINQAITRVAAQISRDYEGKTVLLVTVLKGGVLFLGQLLPQLVGDFQIDFVTIQSYGDKTVSTELNFVHDLTVDPKGMDIVIIEDIIDSGKTVRFLKEHLTRRGANSIKVAALVKKQTESSHPELQPDYFGLEYHDQEFIVGYGFDIGGKYRNLPNIFKI